MSILKSLFISDLKNIQRDSLLKWMIFTPIFSALLIRWLVPYISELLMLKKSFDLSPYYTLILSYFFIVLIPITFGLVAGFSLIDEIDSDTLTAMRVTPLSLNHYLFYKVLSGILLSVIFVFIAIPLANIMQIRLLMIFPSVLLGAIEAPMFGLLIMAFASNKIEAFAVMKFLGIFFLAPLAAWFIKSDWQLLFGLVPTYWPLKIFWNIIDNGTYLSYLIIGFIYHLIIISYLLKRFHKRIE